MLPLILLKLAIRFILEAPTPCGTIRHPVVYSQTRTISLQRFSFCCAAAIWRPSGWRADPDCNSLRFGIGSADFMTSLGGRSTSTAVCVDPGSPSHSLCRCCRSFPTSGGAGTRLTTWPISRWPGSRYSSAKPVLSGTLASPGDRSGPFKLSRHCSGCEKSPATARSGPSSTRRTGFVPSDVRRSRGGVDQCGGLGAMRCLDGHCPDRAGGHPALAVAERPAGPDPLWCLAGDERHRRADECE